ncbi:MAG: hypothetical protein HYW05_04455 [Candidatus Diapherotrites archaeon]|nr:hypothetical protein [Candidatus Diapherotrites archaeon]
MHNKDSRFPLFCLLVALFAIVLFQGVSAVYSWNLQSSTGTATAWSNHKYLARADENTLYAIFVSDNNVYFTRSTNDGIDWNAPVLISTLKKGVREPSVNPSILLDSSNVLHVVWQDWYYSDQSKNWEIFYRSCDTALADCTNAGNWSAITDISNDAAENNYPLMAIDSGNAKHVIWQQNREIYYTKCSSNCNVAGNWSAAVNVSNTATESYNPSIVVTSDRNVGIVWEEVTTPEEIYYKTCASATADCSSFSNWSAAVNVSNDANESFYARAVVDSADRTHIVWSETGDDFSSSYTLYKSCAGACGNAAKWKNKALVSDWNSGKLNEDAFIITDSSNRAHIFWLETANGIGNIRYRTRTSAGTWGAITELTNDLSIGYLGITCNYADFNPAANYEKLDCVWTNKSNSKLVYFAITKEPVPISVPGDQGKLLPTHTYLTVNPTNLSSATPAGANTITVTEFSIYSPYTFGAGTLLPWYYVINSTLNNYTFTIRLVVSYLDRDNDGYEDITGRDENTLAVAYWDNGQWTTVSGSVNQTNNYILITTDHFSTFSLVSLDNPEPQLAVATLSVTPKKKNIREDSKFDFVVHVTGAGDLSAFANATSATFSNGAYALTGINYDAANNQLDMKIDAGVLEENIYEFELLSIDGTKFSTNLDSATVFRPGPGLSSAKKKLISPGITPDMLFYPFKRLFENLDLLFTFEKAQRIEKHAHYAELRLSEAVAMVEADKPEYVDALLEQYVYNMSASNKEFKEVEDLADMYPDLSELLAEATAIHLRVIGEVSGNVSKAAQDTLDRVEDISSIGHEQAVKTLAKENPAKAADIVIGAGIDALDKAVSATGEMKEGEAKKNIESFERHLQTAGEIIQAAGESGKETTSAERAIAVVAAESIEKLLQIHDESSSGTTREAAENAIINALEEHSRAVTALEDKSEEAKEKSAIPSEIREKIERIKEEVGNRAK